MAKASWKKQPKIEFPSWLRMTDSGRLAGNFLVSQYLLDQMKIVAGKIKYDEWGQLWDALYELRKVVPELTAEEFHWIAHDKYEPPSKARPQYERLSNVLDNLYSMYGEEDGNQKD